jgi:hypothetical protein
MSFEFADTSKLEISTQPSIDQVPAATIKYILLPALTVVGSVVCVPSLAVTKPSTDPVMVAVPA